MKVRLFNTFEPVVPVWENIVAALSQRKDVVVEPIVSRGVYRSEQKSKIAAAHRHVFVPGFLRSSKAACHLFYFALAPLKILFASGRGLNIFFTQPPFFYGLAGLLSKLRGTPYIIHVMDLQPDMLVAYGKLKRDGLVHKLTSSLGNYALRNADRVVVIGDCMKQLIVSKGVNPSHVDVIENIAFDEAGAEIPKGQNAYLNKLELGDKFIVSYSGNMGFAHEFDTILEVAGRLSHYSDILFLFTGRGKRRAEIEAHIERHQPTNMRLLDFVPAEELSQSLAAADVHFICLREGFEGVMVPSKFYGCLASGRAIVYEGSPTGEIALELQRSGSGKSVDHRDVDALESSILYYFQHREQCELDGQRGKQRHDSHYSAQHFQEKYAATVSSVLGRHGEE